MFGEIEKISSNSFIFNIESLYIVYRTPPPFFWVLANFYFRTRNDQNREN